MSEAAPLLAARGLSVPIGRRRLVQPTDLALREGEWCALIGPNGAGKSTLVRALATLMPSEGPISFAGEDVRRDSRRYRRHLGVVLHEPMLYRELTALENLELFAKLYQVTDRRQEMWRRLEQVGLVEHAVEPVRRFSRGMLQRLSVARALLHRPRILLLDEPLEGIDATGAEELKALFLHVKEEGVAAIWVTHNWRRAWSVVDEVWEMQRGLIHNRIRTERVSPQTWRPRHSSGLGY